MARRDDDSARAFDRNEILSYADYGSGSSNNAGAAMEKSSKRAAPNKAKAKTAKNPTPFSKAFPPGEDPLPDDCRAVLTWRPTRALKPQEKKAR